MRSNSLRGPVGHPLTSSHQARVLFLWQLLRVREPWPVKSQAANSFHNHSQGQGGNVNCICEKWEALSVNHLPVCDEGDAVKLPRSDHVIEPHSQELVRSYFFIKYSTAINQPSIIISRLGHGMFLSQNKAQLVSSRVRGGYLSHDLFQPLNSLCSLDLEHSISQVHARYRMWIKTLSCFSYSGREIYSFNKVFFQWGWEGITAATGFTAGHLSTNVNSMLLLINGAIHHHGID